MHSKGLDFLVLIIALILLLAPAHAFTIQELYEEATAAREAGDYGRAIELYAEAVAIDPGYADGWLNLGFACYEAGEYAEVEEPLSEALRLGTDRVADAWKILGSAREKLGNYGSALAAYDEAIAAGGDADAFVGAVRCARSLGRDDDAIDYLERGWAEYPDDESILKALRKVLVETGELKGVIGLVPNGSDALLTADLYFVAGDYSRAAEFYRVAYENGEGPAAARGLGFALYELEEYVEAALYLREYVDTENDASAWNKLGNCYVKLEEYTDARDAYEAGLTYAEGTTRDVLERNLAGVDEYLAASESASNKNRARELIREGNDLLEARDYESALAKYSEAAALDPDLYIAKYNVAVVYVKTEEWEKALDVLRALTAAEPDRSEGWFLAARVNAILKNYDSIYDDLRNAVELDPALKAEAREDGAFSAVKNDPEFVELVGE
ncbi:MAG: tetratricopeptide repeat protein [Candidatus Coatesbacteria bacterium]|nr:MAG: tetratricopeptide repeat protein [Candidatus Coatesbacteria bacterium]